MERGTLKVLREGVVFGQDRRRGIAHHARHGSSLGEALLLHQTLERPVATPAGRDFVKAGLGAVGIEDGPDVEALQETAARDVLGQFLDRNAGFDAPDIRLREREFVEGDVARRRQGDLLNGSGHDRSPRRAAGSLSPDLQPVTKIGAALFLSSLPESRNAVEPERRDCADA